MPSYIITYTNKEPPMICRQNAFMICPYLDEYIEDNNIYRNFDFLQNEQTFVDSQTYEQIKIKLIKLN